MLRIIVSPGGSIVVSPFDRSMDGRDARFQNAGRANLGISCKSRMSVDDKRNMMVNEGNERRIQPE